MRLFSLLCAALVFVCIGKSSLSQTSDCKNSRDCIILNHVQLSCVAKRLNRLLVGKANPVYFDASQCDQLPATMGSASLDIKKPEPTAPASNWIELSKTQLKCLGILLPALQANVADPVYIEISRLICP
jgi:hypothetical protein